MNRITTRSTNSDQRQTVSPPEGDTWETALDKNVHNLRTLLMTRTRILIDKLD